MGPLPFWEAGFFLSKIKKNRRQGFGSGIHK